MKRIALYFGMVAALVASCSIQEVDFKSPQKDDVVFYASFEQPAEDGTRVYANEDLLLRWTADDRVSIFNKNTYNQQYIFTGKTGANSGGFKKVETDEFSTGNAISDIVSVYPYQESIEINEDETLLVTLPSEQHYAESTFGLGSNTMVSVSSDNFLQYKNVGGYLMLKLYGEGVSVSSITLKGNNSERLAGKAKVKMPKNGIPSVVMAVDASAEITLVCDTPVTLGATAEESTQFWFVVPPATFEKGFTITAKDKEGRFFTKSVTSAQTIIRSSVKKMAALEVAMASIPNYLTFTAQEDGSMIALVNEGENAPNVEYSFDGIQWTRWDYSAITVNLGEMIYMRGNNENGFSSGTSAYSHFEMTGTIAVSGNIMSLLYNVDFDNKTIIPSNIDCFNRLFVNCTALTSAPELPATTLAESCYSNMFSGCTALTSAPELPATTLEDNCYRFMFSGCTALTSAPELPATVLAGTCYTGMFYGCSGLTSAPELPATILAPWCYNSMFQDCTALTSAPDLPATTLTNLCYQSMFSGCTALTSAPDLPATTLAESCYSNMFSGCTALTSAPELPATTLADYCYYFMFSDCSALATAPDLPASILTKSCYYCMFQRCTELSFIKMLATDISAKNCLNYWVLGVAADGTFVKNPDATWDVIGVNGVPEGWTVVLNGVPEAIDLGLPSGLKWASFNLGASKPEEFGDYYAWGETETKDDYSWATYKWGMGDWYTMTKYCSDSSYGYNGFTDGKTVLDPEDDAAHVNLGGKWRMPTDVEWTELREHCSWAKTTQNNIKGCLVTGTNGNRIFLPAAGGWFETSTSINYLGTQGYYWSSSLDDWLARLVSFDPYDVYRSCCERSPGLSVRPVYAE